MNTAIEKPTTDFAYAEYQSRQRFAISPDNIKEQTQLLRNSDKFIFDGKKWNINPYHGFAVVSMVNNNPDNTELIKSLQVVSAYLKQQLNKKEAYFMLPAHSFHQTIANALSEHRYIENIVNKGILNGFPDMVSEALSKINLVERNSPLKMSMVGLNVFGSCIALLGEFNDEEDFNTIMGFRKQFYNDPSLRNLDVKWTRPFVGHITLAYLGREINENERLALANTINEINKSFPFSNAVFTIAQTELRSYTDLSCFNSKPEYPCYKFVK
jgi:hypothetical protein